MSDLTSLFAGLVGPGMVDAAQAEKDANWAPTQTNPGQEQAVQLAWMFDPRIRAWRNDFASRFGEQPSVDDTEGQYDYRGAILAGARPAPYADDGGHYHWTSGGVTPDLRVHEFKSPDHPTRWMQSYAETFGGDPLEDAKNGIGDRQKAFVQEAARRGLLADFFRAQ